MWVCDVCMACVLCGVGMGMGCVYVRCVCVVCELSNVSTRHMYTGLVHQQSDPLCLFPIFTMQSLNPMA